jgi:hypothetical protein
VHEFFDRDGGFEIDERHVRLHGRAVQRRGGGLAAILARLVPGRSADSEALGRGDDGVERVQHGAGDEGGLVCDPEVADRVEGVCKDDSLRTLSVVVPSLLQSWSRVDRGTYSVAHPHLKNRTVLLRPSLCYFCMARAEFI